MLRLRVYAPVTLQSTVLTLLDGAEGSRHAVLVGENRATANVLIASDVEDGVADHIVKNLLDAGVPSQDIELTRVASEVTLDVERISSSPSWAGGPVVWAELTSVSRQYSHATLRYTLYMVCAGIIATFGVLLDNQILIVGAMAVSPDLMPLCAAAVGFAGRHLRFAGEATLILWIGLAIVAFTSTALTLILAGFDWPPTMTPPQDGGLGLVSGVNASTAIIALTAGVAGMLAFETRASSAVGVAISVSTIPASAFFGVSLALGSWDEAWGAAAVLLVNVLMLLIGSTTTLLGQRYFNRSRNGSAH